MAVTEQTHTYNPPGSGKDLPPWAGGLIKIPTLDDLGLVSGTIKVTVTVKPTGIDTPSGKKGWFAIFINSSLETAGQLGSLEELTLSNFSVSDTDTVTIKWRSALGVTNHLSGTGKVETLMSMDDGTTS